MKTGLALGLSFGRAMSNFNGSGLRLPASTLALWWHRSGLTPTAWVDSVQGISIPGSGSPDVATDGSRFGGYAVAQTSITGSKHWRGTGLSGLGLSGSRPYQLVVGRLRTVGGSGNQSLVGAGAGGSTVYWVRHNSTSGKLEASAPGNSAAISGPPDADTNPHIFEQWCDGVNTYLRIDGVTHSSATSAALAANVDTIGMGCSMAASNFGNSTLALRLWCSEKPPEDEIALVVRWCENEYVL